MQPLRQGMDRAGLIRGAAGNFNLAPAGLAAQGDKRAVLHDLDPATRVWRVILAMIDADDFRPAQAAGEADQQDRPVTQAAQIVGQGCQHVAQILGQDRLFLRGRTPVLAPDASQDTCDVAVLAIQSVPALRISPGQAGESAFNGRNREGRGLARRGCQISNIEPDELRRRGQGVSPTQTAPAREMGPILGIGLQRAV